MFCSKCGNQLLEGALFCQKCGAKVQEERILCQPDVSLSDDTISQKNDMGGAQVVIKNVFQETLDGLKKILFQGILDKMRKIPLNHKAIMQQAASTMHNGKEQTQIRTSDMSQKKSKKLMIMIVTIMVVVIIAINWNGKNDYVATVGNHTPFVSSYGLPYTYEEVIKQYVTSPKWKVRSDGDVHYVDISGKIEGHKVVITIKVSPDPNDSDIVRMNPESVMIDSEKSPTQDDAVEFLFAMFWAYDNGYNDLSDLPW